MFRMVAAAAGAALMAVVMTAGPAMADTQGTTTTLSLPSNRVVWGLEFNFVMSVGINATEGHWVIEAGSPTFPTTILCGGQLPGQTSCAMPPSALPPGNYNLIAIYDGTENFSFSASGLVQLTVVAQQPTNTSLSLSPSTVVFGHEDSEIIQVLANGDTGNPAQGAATVLLGSAPLSPQCTNIPLFNGGNFCRLTASQLQPGTYQLTARFDGSRDFAGSTSAPRTLTVVPQQPTTTNLTLSAASVPFGNEQIETLTATITPAASGTPTGFVTVKAGSTAVCTIILANATGTCSLTASQLARGTYQITATYNGDTTYASSTSSPPQTLTVTRR
jgi:hypothetical protein